MQCPHADVAYVGEGGACPHADVAYVGEGGACPHADVAYVGEGGACPHDDVGVGGACPHADACPQTFPNCSTVASKSFIEHLNTPIELLCVSNKY